MTGYTNHAFALQDSLLLQDMCGDAWIQKSSLTSWRGLGEGAFATVQHCTLKQENGQAVCPPTCWPDSFVRDCTRSFVLHEREKPKTHNVLCWQFTRSLHSVQSVLQNLAGICVQPHFMYFLLAACQFLQGRHGMDAGERRHHHTHCTDACLQTWKAYTVACAQTCAPCSHAKVCLLSLNLEMNPHKG